MSRDPRDEPGIAPWLEAFVLKLLPFLAVAAALYLFLVYGALVALMAIFVFLLAWYIGTLILKIAKKSSRRPEE